MRALCYKTAVQCKTYCTSICNGIVRKIFSYINHTHANMHMYNVSFQVPVHREMHPKTHPIWICPVRWSFCPVMSFAAVLDAWTLRAALSDYMCVCVCAWAYLCVRLSAAPKLVPGFKLHAVSLCRRADQASSTLWVSSLVWCQRDSGWGNPIQTMFLDFFFKD